MIPKESFILAGEDGWPIQGDVRWPTSAANQGALVLVHGFKGFKDWGHFPWVAERLAETGLVVVSINLSGSGIGDDPLQFTELDRFGRNTLSREISDLERTLEALTGGALPGPPVSPRRTVLLGHSRGAVATTVAATRRANLGALVVWAGVGSLRGRYPEAVRQEWRRDGVLPVVNGRTGQSMPIGLSALDDLEAHLDDYSPDWLAPRVTMPHFLIHGTADTSVPVEESEAVARASAGRAELIVLPGADHTFGSVHPFSGEGTQLVRALELTRAFIDKALGEPPAAPVAT